MALATVEEVRRRGGLNHETDFNLYRVADEAELDDLVAEDLALASAYLQDRVLSTYYTGTALGGSSARYDVIFKRAEILITLAFLTLPRKIRRIDGTHYPYDAEDSTAYAELIDNEYFSQAEILIKPYLDIDDGEQNVPSFAFAVTSPLDRTTIPIIDSQLQDVLDEANGAVGVWP